MQQEYMLYIGIVLLFLLLWVLLSLLYSPSQYRELKALYMEQMKSDDHVYEWKENAGPIAKWWFRLTTKNVGHYYE
jgi:hypothetical protein